MKTPRPLGLLAIVTLAAMSFVRAADSSSSADSDSTKPSKVTKLDGTNLFGIVSISDDYTIRISSDSGIQYLPIAQLSQADFLKFGDTKDRSSDGRLWSERKDALEDEKQKESSDSSKKPSSDIEIHLAEIVPFLPVIESYQKSKPDKDESADNKTNASPDQAASTSADSGPSTTLHMFTGPGSLNVPTSPFGGGAPTAVLDPVMGAGSSAAGTGGALIPGAP